MKAKKIFMTVMSLALVACMVFAIAACNRDVTVESVEFENSSITLSVGETYPLMLYITPSSASSQEVFWLSSDPTVATVDNGEVTAVSAGKAKILASVGGKSAICTVTVGGGSGDVNVTGITLNKKVLELEPTASETLTASLAPTNATNTNVSWRSTNENVATVTDGKVTAVGGGITVIIAKALGASVERTDYCVVQVSGDPVEQEEILYVSKVNNLSEDFIMGMDASAVPSVEAARRASGAPLYKNFDGVEQDVFEILKDNGITDIRIRIWNNPKDASGNYYGGGNCDLANAVAIATRCQAAGLGVIIDFHYSDFWADPGKQKAPKAWASMSTDEVAAEIYTFTKESLEEIQKTQVKIKMVQIGNETNAGMAGSFDWATVCNYMNQGSKAVRDVTGKVAEGGAKVAVHFADPHRSVPLDRAATLKTYKVDYDVMGVSYYPFWHGTLSNLKSQLQEIKDTYGKDVMVLETSYAFTNEDADGYGNTGLDETPYPVTVQGQANSVRAIINTMASIGGLGVCYWEGTWIAASTQKDSAYNSALCKQYGSGWAASYANGYDSGADDGACVIDNQALWDSVTGMPHQSLKIFKLVRTGQSTTLKADYAYRQEGYFTVNKDTIELPATAKIALNSGSEVDVPVYWAVTDTQLASYITEVNSYEVHGTTEYGGDCVFVIWVSYPNLLTGGSFEPDEGIEGLPDPDSTVQSGKGLGDWVITNKLSKTSTVQLYVSTKSTNARRGVQSFHFWDSGNISFTLSQTIDLAKMTEYGNGRYTCSFDIMGGNGADMNIFSYVKVTYKDGTTATSAEGNKVELIDWLMWETSKVSVNITDLSNVQSIEVGISVTASPKSGTTGPWGNIDNAQFYFDPIS